MFEDIYCMIWTYAESRNYPLILHESTDFSCCLCVSQVWPDYPNITVDNSLDWDTQVEVSVSLSCSVSLSFSICRFLSFSVSL